MTNKTYYATTHRARWPWVLLAIVVAVAAAVTVWATSRPSDEKPASPTRSESEPISADACLGGDGDMAKAVLTARDEAPLTPDGAASFIATVIRWSGTLPTDPTQIETVGPEIWSSDFPESLKAEISADSTDPSTAVRSSVVGKHYVVLDSGEDYATVALSVDVFTGQTLSAQAAVAPRMVVEDGHWRWAGWDSDTMLMKVGDDQGATWRKEIDSTGTAFRGAC